MFRNLLSKSKNLLTYSVPVVGSILLVKNRPFPTVRAEEKYYSETVKSDLISTQKKFEDLYFFHEERLKKEQREKYAQEQNLRQKTWESVSERLYPVLAESIKNGIPPCGICDKHIVSVKITEEEYSRLADQKIYLAGSMYAKPNRFFFQPYVSVYVYCGCGGSW